MTKLVERNLLPEIKKVEKMSRKEYLKYYITILTENVKEAQKVLNEKKTELKNLK